jgi:hypothetical protein
MRTNTAGVTVRYHRCSSVLSWSTAGAITRDSANSVIDGTEVYLNPAGVHGQCLWQCSKVTLLQYTQHIAQIAWDQRIQQCTTNGE